MVWTRYVLYDAMLVIDNHALYFAGVKIPQGQQDFDVVHGEVTQRRRRGIECNHWISGQCTKKVALVCDGLTESGGAVCVQIRRFCCCQSQYQEG